MKPKLCALGASLYYLWFQLVESRQASAREINKAYHALQRHQKNCRQCNR